MLLYGVVARTQKSFDGLPALAEITHHQLVVATALASNKVLFFAGLLHDILKPLLKFKKSTGGWQWHHLDGLEVDNTKANLEKIFKQGLSSILSENDIELLTQLILQHHQRDAVRYNPIAFAENDRSGLGIAIMEATLFPKRNLEHMGLYTCIEAKGLIHPYHFFVLTLIYQGIKYYLNKVYSEIFSSQGLTKLIVEYNFGSEKLPEIRYDNGNSVLTIRYYIPSTLFKDWKVSHEYEGEASFNIKEIEAKNIKIYHSWSDILTLLVPSLSINGLAYKVLCVIPRIITYGDKGIIIDGNAISSFVNRARKIVDNVLAEIQEHVRLDSSYDEVLLRYVEGTEQGNFKCIFCGKRTDREVKLSRGKLLSERFTDYHRIQAGVSVCPLCHVGFSYEELLRNQGPAFYLPLPCEISSIDIADDFKQKYLTYGACPINPKEGVVLSVLGLSTMQLMSNAWYMSLLKEIDRRSPLPSWIKPYTLRAQKDVNEFYVKFLINRKIVIYPLIVKIRPKALISSYGGENKKFVLNTEILEGHTLWRGSELDVTEEHLDVLEALTTTLKYSAYKKVYGKLVSLYGLRE
jgi:hypothetical protein